MPPKQLAELIKTLHELRTQLEKHATELEKHLKEGVVVKNDIDWLKGCYKDLRALNIGLFVCVLGAVLKYALGR